MQSKEKRMKLVGDLKKQVEKTNSKEEAKEVIEKAGMLLTDDELDNITGGLDNTQLDLGYCNCTNNKPGPLGIICPICGETYK